jgi:membrane protease YdiL (CAAX protease family)
MENSNMTVGDASPTRESKLVQRPLLASLLIVLLYVVFIILLPPPPWEENPMVLVNATIFGLLIWFVIVPRWLGLPDGRQPLRPYLERIRLTRVQPIGRNIVLGAASAVLFLITALIFLLLSGSYAFDLAQILPPDTWILLTALVPGFWEEVVFRGVIFALLLKKQDKTRAILMSSVLFAVPHLINLLTVGSNLYEVCFVLSQVGFAFFVGLFLAYLVTVTDSLLPTIVFHYIVAALSPLVINTPGADPVIRGILLFLGGGVVPAVIAMSVVKKVFTDAPKASWST